MWFLYIIILHLLFISQIYVCFGDSPLRGFGSDNNSGVHPRVMAALAEANQGHVPGYGDDPFTPAAAAKLSDLLGGGEVFFVFGGTGANVTGLAAALEPYQSVVCAEMAHINVDECGAVERLSGARLMDLPSPDGKLRADQVEPLLEVLGDVHAAQPHVLSITQPTELGTLYSIEEIHALASFAHARGMLLHMDGARIANAAAALDAPVSSFTREAGVDILSFGGTKNGLMFGEAVVFFDHGQGGYKRLVERYVFLRKQGTQLASKMRYIAAQFSALLEGNLWLENARRANAMAQRLADEIAVLPGFSIAFPVQANLVFLRGPEGVLKRVRERYFFYGSHGAARLVCSFDTTEGDVDGFLEELGRSE
jgi:threonine aldolase